MENADTQAATELRYASDPPPHLAQTRSPRVPSLQVPADLTLEKRSREARRIATEFFPTTGSWVVFFREILGVDGACRKLFPTADEMQQFQSTAEFAELQEMVAALRGQDNGKGDAVEPERMITIRLPKSLHDALRVESEELNLSINKLCISKLLQGIDGRHVPLQKGRRRGRRPGPQGPRKSKAENQ